MEIIPYIFFNGQCEEAMKFYEKVFGGKIQGLMTYGDSPAAKDFAADQKNRIIHARMNVGSSVLMASDAPPNDHRQPQGFSLSVSVKDPTEAERVFAALAENGTIQMPIAQTFWSVRFGMLTDQFGMPWMVNCEEAASTVSA
jgi:PhnB protein